MLFRATKFFPANRQPRPPSQGDGNEAAAEDAVQETFLRAYRSLQRFDERAQFGTWLHRIAVNAAIELMRRYES